MNTKNHSQNTLKMLAIVFFLSAIICCNSNYKGEKKDNASTTSDKEVIPDSVVQFLISSAAKDFYDHQPPTVMDIRNVKAGYILSDNELTYLLCGEFLSKEKNDWESFETVKTYGYEQNIGHSFFCPKATFEKKDNNSLSEELKRKLNQLRK